MAPGAAASAVNAKSNNGAGGYASGGYGDVSSLPQARAVPVYEGSPADDPYNARGASVAAAARTSSTSAAAIALANNSGRASAPGRPYPSATATPAAPATASIYPSFGAPPVQQPYGGQRRPQNYTNTNPDLW